MYNSNLHSKALSKFSTLELGKPKDILVVTDERDIAEEVRDNIIEQIENYGHIGNTEKLINSISAVREGDEYVVKGIDYAKYVNGYDRETYGIRGGFVDIAVRDAIRSNPGERITQLI